MTNHPKIGDGDSGQRQSAAGKDSIARLVRLAGPRPVVPEDVRSRVHAAVRREWQQSFRRRRTLQWGLPFALAALVVLAVTLNGRAPELAPGVAGVPIATVARVDGQADPQDSGWAPGAGILPGMEVSTGDFGMALAMNNGFSIRLAANTTVTFESGDSLLLDTGRVYADTGQAIYDDRSITVRTRVGAATDTGTQFAVHFAGGNMQVAVREGKVDVATAGESYTAEAGDLLTVDPGREVAFDQISVYDSSWEWAAALAPAFDIEDRSLLDFLKWAARESGKELVFENENVRIAAMGTILSGSVNDFTPMEAVDSVLPTTRFAHRVDARRITITLGDPLR